MADATIEALKAELSVARQAQDSLEEQKHANLMLKETIDRLRLDIDEIRTTTTSTTNGSAGSSARSTLTKSGAVTKKALASLAAELGELQDDEKEDSLVEDAASDEETTTGGSGFVETIITTSRKRVSNSHILLFCHLN